MLQQIGGWVEARETQPPHDRFVSVLGFILQPNLQICNCAAINAQLDGDRIVVATAHY